ncbi:cation-independent mannose-6-phosphate receptor isoform X1 [Drosophila sulfurigaster albostrigata]|uniref:cation-independent mannose-6-phosphate receptor isoform X1 n=1 Tax=Drosophila sulfurigaster albostrigata TaxID=89887 RepID=UPI002D21D80F|nr:cation-independent mannose-6-phosphate receptor isoform X1 [Drosophila sulfurigaster albostrigata]
MSNVKKIGFCGATTASIVAIILLATCNVSAANDANQLDLTSHDCTITEPVYGYKFNFSGLRSELAHVVKNLNEDVFEFNVCGNLTHSCNNESNVAACLKKGGKEYVLGRQHELKYHNGKMYFNYLSGAKCPNGTAGNANYQLHVILSCDYTMDVNQFHITSYSDDACSFYINYETSLACLPVPDALQSNSCSVRYNDVGGTFDLMSLSDANYRTIDRDGGLFIINICKPVLYGENTMCPSGSSICLYDRKATDLKKRFINFGNVNSQPEFKDNLLFLRHNSSTPCAGNSSANYSSIVNFHCDNTIMNEHPEFMGTDHDGCTYHFNIFTPLACKQLKPCAVIASDNELLDLSALSKHPPHQLTKDGKTYTVAVCASAGTPCLSDGGACYAQNEQTYNLGNFNTHLRFNQSGSPYLLYEEGAVCDASGRRWTTKIEFVCANNATKDNGTNDAVQIIEDSNCQLLIQYQTPLACLQQIRCKAKFYEELVDLTPLVNANDNYEARIELPPKEAQRLAKNTKFFLNVCRPLVPKYQLGCAGGSGACMAKISAANAPEEEQSLGFPLVKLSALNDTAAELLYLRGDPCPNDKAMNLSTTIHFNCNMTAGRGQPALTEIDDCHYHFDWGTSVICPPHECTFNSDTCEIVQEEAHQRFNFKNASFTKDGKIEIAYKQQKVQLNVCGMYRKTMTDYSQDLVNLFFTHDLPGCGKEGKMNVHLRLICSNTTENTTTITEDTQCSLLYVQRTPSICHFLGLSAPPEDTTAGGSSTSSTTSTTTTTPSTTTSTTTSSTHTTPFGKPSEAVTTTTTTTAATVKATEATAAATAAAVPSVLAAVPSPTASVGTIMGIILSVTFFVACLGMFAFSPARRQRVRRLFRRSSSAVRYSRVQSNEEANLLLEPNGEFTESDDDMLL